MAETIAVHEGSVAFMLPGMSSPEVDSDGLNFSGSRVVRFDSECVLIPEVMQRKHSLMVTKSYSLPLWKRRANNIQSDEDPEDGGAPGSSTARPSSPDDSRLVIKVPIPLFRRKSSRSPTRGRSVSLSPVITKRAPSCLVDRSISPIATPLSPVRRPSLAIYHRRKDEMTVPLRACCEACEFATEESLREGENWHEKFSRGAKRRRSGSLDTHDEINSLFQAHTHGKQAGGFAKEFAALSVSLDSMGEGGLSPSSSPPTRYGAASMFTLTVDEVDKRRKSLDMNRDALQSFYASPSPPPPSSVDGSGPSLQPSSSPQSPRSLHPQRYLRVLGLGITRERESSSSSSSPTGEELIIPDILDPRHRLRSSPIEEEDEAQLFPLPSPRRSPNGTPSPRLSPNPSPRASSSSLVLPVLGAGSSASGSGGTGGNTTRRSVSASASSSKDSVESNAKLSSSQESLLKASFSRKPASASASTSTSTTSGGAAPTSLPRSPSPLSFSTTSPTPAPTTKRVEMEHSVLDQADPMKRLSNSGQGLKISTTSLSPSGSNEKASAAANSAPPALGLTSPKGPRPPSFRRSSSSSLEQTKGGGTSTPPMPPIPLKPSKTSQAELISFPAGPTSTSTSTSPKIPLVPLRLAAVSGLPPSSSSSLSSTSSSTSSSTLPIPMSKPIPTPKPHDPSPTQSPPMTHSHSPFHIHSPFHVSQTTQAQEHTQTHAHAHDRSASMSSTHTRSGSGSGSGSVGSPGTSPSATTTQKRKQSFSSSFIRAGEALRDVGVDMLKGVSSMSGPGVV